METSFARSRFAPLTLVLGLAANGCATHYFEAPTASIDHIVRPVSLATFVVQADPAGDAPVCSRFALRDHCALHFRDQLDQNFAAEMARFLTVASDPSNADYTASLSVEHFRSERRYTGGRYGALLPEFVLGWRLQIRDRCGNVVIAVDRDTRSHQRVEAAMQEIQTSVLREARALLNESIIGIVPGPALVPSCPVASAASASRHSPAG